MWEFYFSENDKGFKILQLNLWLVVIVGGGGQMGCLFEKMLMLFGYQVCILEKNDWVWVVDIVVDVGMVIVSVLIYIIVEMIGRLLFFLVDCILVDFVLVKVELLQVMLVVYQGLVFGLYLMFGLDSGSLVKQVVVYCDGCQLEVYQWFFE